MRKLRLVAGGKSNTHKLIMAFEDYKLVKADWIFVMLNLTRANIDNIKKSFRIWASFRESISELAFSRFDTQLAQIIGTPNVISGLGSLAATVAMRGDGYEIASISANLQTRPYNRQWIEVSRSQFRFCFETLDDQDQEITTVWVPQRVL
jgi:hypothetical protein